MKIEAIIDLDEIMVAEWDTTVAAMVRDELKAEIKREIRTAIKHDPKLKQAVKKIQTRYAEQIIEAMNKEQDHD